MKAEGYCLSDVEATATRNQFRAREIIEQSGLVGAWLSVGAEPKLVGSLRMGLLVSHRDIDFHIYSDLVHAADGFAAVGRMAENYRITRVEYANRLDTPERCMEWHAWCLGPEGEEWQLDMIHLVRGSRYDGYFERMADRICAVMTPAMRETILKLKYETPHTERIMGVEYYQAVIRDGVTDFDQFRRWREMHPVTGIVEWIP